MSARYRVRQKLATVDRFETHDFKPKRAKEQDSGNMEKARRKAREEGKIDAQRFDVNEAA
jgi:hypothetical protein